MTIKKFLTAALALAVLSGALAGAAATSSTYSAPVLGQKLPPDWGI